MKRIEYICDKCNKQIDKDNLFQIRPCRLDPKNDNHTADLEKELEEELFGMLDNKHLCLECLRKTLSFFNGPMVINQEHIKNIPIYTSAKEGRLVIDPAIEEKIHPVLEEETVKKLQEEGMTINEMAVFFGTTYNKLYKWMMRRDLIVRTYKKEAPEEKPKEIKSEETRPEKELIKKIEKEVRPFNTINNLSKNITRAKLDENIPSPKAVEAFKRKAFY